MSLMDDDYLYTEPSEAELAAIENGEDPFDDPDWNYDQEVDFEDYSGAEYDAFDSYDKEYDF